MPPPAEGLASRLVLGPALRAQPDRRLVSLVREGYESAFEEIVRRYAKPLARYAGAIVGARAEDVTQDAFSKALQALRRDESEIELRPWLYRIVRNTALNDLRDRPEETAALVESIAGGRTAAEIAEQREQLADLIERLRALPEPQRAAIVMRELEGLSHEQIAAALGLSGGGARQAIYRARQALRDGAALLLPLPIMRFLIDHGGDAATAGAAGSAGGAVVAATGASGAGAGGVALKAGVAAAVLAGSVGTGVALRDENGGRTADASPPPARVGSSGPGATAGAPTDDSSGAGSGDDRGGHPRGGSDHGKDDRRESEQPGRDGGDREREGRHHGRGRSDDGHRREGRPPHERERHGDGGHRGPRPERHGDRDDDPRPESHEDRSGPSGGDHHGDDRSRTDSGNSSLSEPPPPPPPPEEEGGDLDAPEGDRSSLDGGSRDLQP